MAAFILDIFIPLLLNPSLDVVADIDHSGVYTDGPCLLVHTVSIAGDRIYAQEIFNDSDLFDAEEAILMMN